MNTNALLNPIKQTEQYSALLSCLKKLNDEGKRLPLLANGLCDGAESALIYSLVDDLKKMYGKCVLILVDEERRANRLNDFFRKSGMRCEFYPVRDFNFYDMTASREIEYDRLRVLCGVAFSTLDAVITTPDALLQFTMPKEELLARTFSISIGDTVDTDELLRKLLATGYSPCELVEGAGQYAVRGGIIDIFPTLGASVEIDGQSDGEALPIRIELFGDEIDRLTLFDPITQRSRTPIERFSITPSKEIIADDDKIAKIRDQVSELLGIARDDEDAEKEEEKSE